MQLAERPPMRLLACLTLAAAACTAPTFPNDLTGTSSSSDLRMHVEVHQRLVEGAPSTLFLSNPEEMEVKLADQLTAGAVHEVRWTPQGRPVTPSMIVAALDPARITTSSLAFAVETGSLELSEHALPVPGRYSVNLVRHVDYFHVDDDDRLTLKAMTYWHKVIEAVPPPIL